jgi:Tol biopolymer transport system component
MSKKHIGFGLFAFTICIILTIRAGEKSSSAGISEKLIVHIEPASWVPGSFKVSPDSRRIAYVIKVWEKRAVVIDGKEEKPCEDVGEGNPIFSPDGKRVAYGAKKGDKGIVVVDGQEQKAYDDISVTKILFSPDSKRIVYGAREDSKWSLVIDGKEEKPYDGIGGNFVFSPDSFHYFVIHNNGIYLVEETIE